MRYAIIITCALSLVSCGGLGRRESTTAARASRTSPSARERRALAMFPESVFAVARYRGASFATEPALEGLHTIFAEADPDTAAIVDAIESVYVGVGPWSEVDRMCFRTIFDPDAAACNETVPIEAFPEEYDDRDDLVAWRLGPDGKPPAFYVLVQIRDAAICSSLVEGEEADSRGLRVARRGGAVLFNAGDGLCGLAPATLAASLRSPNTDIVSTAASALGGTRSEVLGDLAIDARHPGFAAFVDPEGASVETFRIRSALRMILPLLDTLDVVRAEVTTDDRASIHVDVRADYIELDHARATEAIVGFLANYVRERVDELVSRGHTTSDEFMRLSVAREGLTDRVAIRFGDRSLEYTANELLSMNPRYRSAYWRERDDEDEYPIDDDEYASMIEVYEAVSGKPPREALAELASARANVHSDYVAVPLLAELVDRAIESGRFDVATTAIEELGVRAAALGYPTDAQYRRFEAAVLLATIRHDVEALEAAGEALDAFLAEDRAYYGSAPYERLRELVTDRLTRGARRVQPGGSNAGIARPYVDRGPAPVLSLPMVMVDELLATGAFADALAIQAYVDAEASSVESSSGCGSGIGARRANAAFDVRFALAHLGAGHAREARAIVDAALAPDATPGYVERTELTWVQCRVMRFAGSDATALPTCRQAVEFAMYTHGPEHPYTARAKVELAEAELGAGHRDVARRLATEALAALDATTHASHPLRATARALARPSR